MISKPYQTRSEGDNKFVLIMSLDRRSIGIMFVFVVKQLMYKVSHPSWQRQQGRKDICKLTVQYDSAVQYAVQC